MNDLNTLSLAQIVSNDYRTAAVFEKYQLDFCCKGKRSLEQACSEKGMPAAIIINELENITVERLPEPAELTAFSLGQLADYIIATHHKYVTGQLPIIYGFLQKLAGKHGDRYPNMVKVLSLFTGIKEELEPHMQKEEIVLFPRIRMVEQAIKDEKEITVNSVFLQGPINMMEQEHEQAGDLMAEIRQLTNNYTPPEDACTTHRMVIDALHDFGDNLHRHIHLENNVLFPRALNMFKQAGQILCS